MSSSTGNDVLFRSTFIKTDVTAIKIVFDFIVAGIGHVLHVIRITDKKCQYFPILNGQRIHGIHFNAKFDSVVIYGNREIVVASFYLVDGNVFLDIVSRWIVGDWICDVMWSYTDILIILTASNIVSAWNWKMRTSNKMVKCHDKCLLFCGTILGTEWSDAVVLCGTMFRSILIWAPSSAVSDTCNILHKLLGHKGAIFSVFYHEISGRICSTSDDRSTRIWLVNFPSKSSSVVEAWSNAKIIPLFSVFGHMSRVWKSLILNDTRFISAGEDCQLRVWSKSGQPLLTWETHQGASIRSVDVCEKLNVIVTGGKDGGISLWPLHTDKQIAEITFCDNFNVKNARDVPRRLLLTKFGNLLTITNKGMLLMHSNAEWHCVNFDCRFASYCLLEVSPSRTYISLASIMGDVKILKELENKLSVIVFNDRICDGKIFSLHWLSDHRFVTCCVDGKLEVWNLNLRVSLNLNSEEYNVFKISDHILPSCKERWLTSAVEFPNGIVVGDREGSVHLFSSDVIPHQTFRRIHGRLGVSWISRIADSELCSIGRDGFIRYWNIRGIDMEHLSADKLPVKWPVRVFESPSYGLLVLGFNEINFEVWNMKEKKKLFTFKCGGGHRPWDFVIDKFVHFVFIREKIICNVFQSLSQLVEPSCLEGFHIRDIVCIRFLSENVIISGGEDTTLRLSRLNGETRSFRPVTIIRSHISSIRAIAFVQVDDFILTVSVGGRAQMKVWKFIISEDNIKHSELASHMLKPSSKCRKPWMNMIHTYELEPRHMDVKIVLVNESDLIIYAAGSDAFWRIYSFNLTTKSLELLKEIEYSNYCILKLLIVEWHNEKYVITFATDGRATFWNMSNYLIEYQQSVHQSGINSCDYVIIDDHLVLVTGGDDASLVVTLFENVERRIEMIAHWKNSSVHEAQISGIHLSKNFIISVGADQKVVLWQWEIVSNLIRVDFKTFYHSFIPDIHGLDVTPSKESICVYGAGVEVLSLNV